MTFTQVFGGTTIYPAGVSYRAVALSADQTLAWPVETATSGNVVAQIMDITPSAGSLSIIMPPANEVSVGETTLFFNAGSFAFTVKDDGGNTIVSIAAGLSYQVYLIGNSTVNGTWRSTQYSAGTSSATAGSLIGAGIKAINTSLNQSMSVTSVNSNYPIGDADRSEAFVWTGGAGTLTLPSAVSVLNDWFCHVRNSGTGAVSLATVGGQLINGAASLAFNPGDSAIVICDGSNFFTIGFGQSASFAFDYVSIDLTSQTSPYTLAGANLNRIAYTFGGALTANMVVEIPATIQQYWLSNETTGGFAITVKVSGQTGVTIANGVRAICYCNGTDLVDADTSSFSFPVSVAQGGTGATTESGARINLGGTSTGIAVFTSASASAARTAILAASSGANSDITSLTGLTTPLSVLQGGTGVTTSTGTGSVVLSASPTLTGTVSFGGVATSAPAWTTTGVGVRQVTTTYTDTTTAAAATITDTRMNYFAPQTYAATNAITITTLFGNYFSAPARGTNVSGSGGLYGVYTDGIYSVGPCYIESGTAIGLNGAITTFTTSGSIGLGNAQVAGTFTVGGTSGTGTITLGRSTVSQTTDIQAGITASGSTKTINVGTSGAAGSTTNIAIGGTAGTSTTTLNGSVVSSALADAVGYKGLPQNPQTATYTLALSDMGKHISITTGGVIIPANGSVAFPIGSAISIFNNSAVSQTISITTDTLRQAGTANTGSRTLAQYGLVTCVKVAATTWVISGAGLS